LPENAPGNRCPKCLLQLGLEETANDDPPKNAPDPGGEAPEPSAETPVPPADLDSVVERPGTVIGRYRLLQQIGAGGFGVVFMAEQTEPVHRRVALKVIKAGMDTRGVIARFEAERQALAMMDHPNIARVLDGGTTASRRPYFVMELVRGIPITDYCDQANLSTRERLELFIKVCRAVQHAHQKGIIHRDLKPSNVLVTLHDGEPVPKVIDFGVAKALDQKLTEKTLFTRFEQMIGTPAYMSPEQAALSGLDIDTRSDTYSLGVLLYELLTGVTPLDAEALRKGALEEIRRIIRETDPPKPSTRLQTMGGRLAQVARCRHAEPAALSRLVRGDLDWITMKCLEKDRHRRYETVNGLAMDLERHLHNEPVMARPTSRAYQFQKLIRRNKLVFSSVALIFVVLALGIVGSTWEALRARRAEREQAAEKKKAEAEAIRSQQVAQDLLFALGQLGSLLSDETKLSQAEDVFRQSLTVARRNDQGNDHRHLASALNNLSRILVQEGKLDEGEALQRETLEVLRKTLGDQRLNIAIGLFQLGLIRGEQGKMAEAEKLMVEQLPVLRELDLPNRFVWDVDALAKLLMGERKFDEAEAQQQEALRVLRKVPGDQRLEIAKVLGQIGAIRCGQGRLTEAEKMITEQLPTLRELGDPKDVAWSLATLSRLLKDERKLVQAEEAARETLAMQRGFYPPNHHHLYNPILFLAECLCAEGKLDESETYVQEALAILRKAPGDHRLEIARALGQFASIRRQQGRKIEAEKILKERTSVLRELGASKDLLMALGEQGYFLSNEARLPEAEAIFRESLTVARHNDGGKDGGDLAWALNNLSRVLVQEGKLDEGEALQQETLEILRKTTGDQRLNIAIGLFQLGDIRHARGKMAEAEKLMIEQLPTLRQLDPPDWLIGHLSSLANLLSDEGKLPQAEEAFREALAIARRLYEGGDHRYLANNLGNVAGFLVSEGKFDEAQPLQQEALEVLRKTPQAPSQYAQTVINLVTSYFPQQKFRELEASYPKWLQNVRARLPADDPALADILAQIVCAPMANGNFEGAEKLAREYMAIYEKRLPNDWRTYEARGTLGNCLVHLKKYADAEPLLLSGCESLRQHAAEIPGPWKPRASSALQSLVQLYEATGRSDLASEWRQKCQEFDRPSGPQQTRQADGAITSKQ